MSSNVMTTVKCEKALFCGVNMVKDWNNVTEVEKNHLPIITAPESIKKDECFEATVEIGRLMQHPNEPGHHSRFIELYAGYTYLARIDLTAIINSRLRAFAHCNLHGTWEGDADIEMAD